MTDTSAVSRKKACRHNLHKTQGDNATCLNNSYRQMNDCLGHADLRKVASSLIGHATTCPPLPFGTFNFHLSSAFSVSACLRHEFSLKWRAARHVLKQKELDAIPITTSGQYFFDAQEVNRSFYCAYMTNVITMQTRCKYYPLSENCSAHSIFYMYYETIT